MTSLPNTEVVKNVFEDIKKSVSLTENKNKNSSTKNKVFRVLVEIIYSAIFLTSSRASVSSQQYREC